MTGNTEETGNNLFWCDSCSNNFRWVLLVLEDPYDRLLFWLQLICIDPWFVTCVDVIHSLWWTLNAFYQYFLSPIDTSFLLSIYQIMWKPAWTNLFCGQMLCNILLMLVQRYPNLTVCHMTILLSQFSHRIDIFWKNNRFWTTCMEFVLDRPRLN